STQIVLTALEDFAARIDGAGEINSEKPQEITNLAPTRYHVEATALGETCYLASDTVVDLSAGAKSETVPVILAAAGAIHGKLSGAANPAEFAVALVAVDPDNSSQPVQVVFPASDGRFVFAALSPGR